MRHPTLIVAIAVVSAIVLSSCGSDDQLGSFTPEHPPVPPAVVNETTDIEFNFTGAQAAAATPAAADPSSADPTSPDPSSAGPSLADDATPTTTTPLEIPDSAINLTGRAEVTIEVKDNAFTKRVVVITEGTTVTWDNGGLTPHNVIPSIDGSFDPILTGDLDAGQTATLTFAALGAVPYYCSLHGTPRHGMNGLILVVPAA